jgi:cadmium resistance protein CadD (predicted permease)
MSSTPILLILLQGAAAFATTNVDDIVLLALYFAQTNASLRRRHIIAGQYLGFAAIVGVSLLGLLGALVLPKPVIALLGLVPIVIGVRKLLQPHPLAPSPHVERGNQNADSDVTGHLLGAPTMGVAAVTLANGADNVSIYVPLFAAQHPANVTVIIGLFFGLVGVWCYAGYRIAHQPAVGQVLSRYGARLMPYVLIALGASIVLGIV